MGKFQKGHPKIGGRAKGTKNKNINLNITKNLYENLIGGFKTGKNYVYYHVCQTTNEIVYIGKGKNNRAWDFSEKARNVKWHNYKNNNQIDVKIVAADLSETEANEIEKALIKCKNPILNIIHNNETM